MLLKLKEITPFDNDCNNYLWNNFSVSGQFCVHNASFVSILKYRYGTQPFDLRTLNAAYNAIKDLTELSYTTYISGNDMCLLGAFAVQETITTKGYSSYDYNDETIRGYLIEAKKFDARTVDALETVNQHFGQKFSGKQKGKTQHYNAVKQWIVQEIEKSKKDK